MADVDKIIKQKEDIKKWIIEDESVSIEININLTKLLFLLNKSLLELMN